MKSDSIFFVFYFEPYSLGSLENAAAQCLPWYQNIFIHLRIHNACDHYYRNINYVSRTVAFELIELLRFPKQVARLKCWLRWKDWFLNNDQIDVAWFFNETMAFPWATPTIELDMICNAGRYSEPFFRIQSLVGSIGIRGSFLNFGQYWGTIFGSSATTGQHLAFQPKATIKQITHQIFEFKWNVCFYFPIKID